MDVFTKRNDANFYPQKSCNFIIRKTFNAMEHNQETCSILLHPDTSMSTFLTAFSTRTIGVGVAFDEDNEDVPLRLKHPTTHIYLNVRRKRKYYHDETMFPVPTLCFLIHSTQKTQQFLSLYCLIRTKYNANELTFFSS